MTVTVTCQACKAEGEHDVLAEGRELLVRCGACGFVHRIPAPREPETIHVKAIVSRGAESRICGIELLPDDPCTVGDQLVAECGDEAVGVEVTAIEHGGRRVETSRAADAETVWTRVIENVVVKVSVHDGKRTIPLYLTCDGEEPFAVDEIYSSGKIRFRISHIKLREGQILRKEGWKTVAHKITRIYAYRV
jgi:uncharacterized Zn finger protein